MVQNGCYLGASVVIKKLHTGTAAEVTKVFMKEAKYLYSGIFIKCCA